MASRGLVGTAFIRIDIRFLRRNGLRGCLLHCAGAERIAWAAADGTAGAICSAATGMVAGTRARVVGETGSK